MNAPTLGKDVAPLITDPRRAALAAMAAVPVAGTGIVNYATGSRVLVVGENARAIATAHQLPAELSATVVLLDAPLPRVTDLTVVAAHRREFVLDGHLGDFRARLSPGGEVVTFDQVLDLCHPPLLTTSCRTTPRPWGPSSSPCSIRSASSRSRGTSATTRRSASAAAAA